VPDWKPEIRRRLARLQLAPTRENAIVEELAQHLDESYAELLACGVSEAEGQRQVLTELNENDLLARELRRVERQVAPEPIILGTNRRTNMIADLWQDLRYGARMLVKQPGFTLIAVLTLALGIGANTAIFSVVYHVLLKPLPYQDSEQLVWVWGEQAARKQTPHTPADFLDYQRRNQSFAQMAAYRNMSFSLGGAGQSAQPERVDGRIVSANYFVLLGVAPRLGRSFAPEDGQAGAARLVLLSHRYWQQRFGGEAGIVGQSLTLSGEPATIVGVMPPDFREPGVDLWTNPRLIVPDFATNLRDDLTSMRRNPYLSVMARLKPGVTLPQAQADMDAITAGMRQEYPDLYGSKGVRLIALHEFVVGDTKPALLLLFGAVGLVLLIVCANVANLTMARAATRTKEFALRVALGAGRGRLIRQLLTESVLLAFAGGICGLGLATWGLNLLVALSPEAVPRLAEIRLGWRVLSFALGASLLTGIVFGVLPALTSARVNLNETLKEGGRGAVAGVSQRTRGALVAAEVALALVVLVSAGLLVKSFWRLQQVNPGFDATRLTTMLVWPTEEKYAEVAASRAFIRELNERLEKLPGTEGVAISNDLPIRGRDSSTYPVVEGRPLPKPGEGILVGRHTVNAAYFQAMKIPLLRGRALTERDDENAPLAVVINESAANALWPGEDALGKRMKLARLATAWAEVVGIVGEVKHDGLHHDAGPHLYLSNLQFPWPTLRIAVRSTLDAAAVVTAVRGVVQSLDPLQPVSDVKTMANVLADANAGRQLSLVLFALFAFIALLLACIGIYGVTAYSVSRRTRELGIRMALGAQRRDVSGLVIRQGMKPVLIGIVIGLSSAFFLTRWMSSLLFRVSANDPLTFAGIALLLVAIALLACYVPARRATKVDPMIALRSE
jgi:putative ABC transport system permease protein